MDQDQHETPVVFRKFKASEGASIIALFPTEPAHAHGYSVSSYMHVGQHGAADPGLVHDTKLATPEEYADLKAELEGIGYRLKICRRITRHHREAFLAEQRRTRRF